MIKLLAVATVAALSIGALATDADAQRRSRSERIIVEQAQPALDLNTLLLLGTLGSGGAGFGASGMSSILPLLLGGGLTAPQTIIIEERSRRRGGRRVRETGPLSRRR